MKKYILFFIGGSPDEKNKDEIMLKWRSWISKLAQGGIFLSGNPFSEDGCVISKNETIDCKSDIGGYLIIKTDSFEESVSIAKDSPNIALGGKVEIHQVQEMR